MSLLQPYVDNKVLVLTLDGRILIGTLRGTDQTANIILEHCEERVFSSEGTEVVKLGLFLIRGDNVCTIGEIDTEKDESIDLSEIKADPIGQAVL
ncbi:n-alpha-acetyltransferase 38, NatC auxiliary subunit-like protein [Mycotypha africana]|uniref:n-alpha-acetyltransferase 38, NatC auxiliary subunit-like protein n=1 Tax=Mycotypha africana TaxID=64632 RepID=UPI0023013244|nr:n-alpha-acetyltransferase 38, NatC auxiliary subunit-like protein [Mycotypha africana]KAI8977404.1 n-alpha-acetyltransferase 38, NatC auxiliary subunit-like protein [Mycotypha africana]